MSAIDCDEIRRETASERAISSRIYLLSQGIEGDAIQYLLANYSKTSDRKVVMMMIIKQIEGIRVIMIMIVAKERRNMYNGMRLGRRCGMLLRI